MFLDLNGVLVKFWIEQGRPDKEVKIELLERMLHWYKKMGYIVQDNQEGSTEAVGEDLEEAAEESWVDYEYREHPKGLYYTCYIDGFKAGAKWQLNKLKDKDNEKD